MSINHLDLNEVYSLIDFYKCSSIDGERVELSISPQGSQRAISIKISDSDKQTLYFENGDEFDKSICSKIIKYFSSCDPLGKWKIVEPVEEQDTISATAETRSGNIVYLDTNNRDLLIDNSISSSSVLKNRNEDIVWEEILFLVRNILTIKDIKGIEDNDFNKIITYLNNLDLDKVKPGISDSSLAANITYLKSILSRDTELTDDLINMLETSILAKASNYLGVRKQVSNRIDLDNESIKEKISFAFNELAKVGYFKLGNDLTKLSIQGRMKMISKILDNKEKNELYSPFCYELIGFNFRKIGHVTDLEEKIVDSYDKLESLIDELNSTKTGKRYEIIIDNSHDVSIVRIDSIEGNKRRVVSTFEFTDKDLFSKKINEIVTKIYKTDPATINTTCVVRDLSNSLGINTIKAHDNTGIIFTSGRKLDTDIDAIIESIQKGKETKDLCERKYNSLIEKINISGGTIEDVKKITYFEFKLRRFYEQEIANLDDLESARKDGEKPTSALFNSILDVYSKHQARFEVTKQDEEKEKPDGIIAIEDAYNESLDYATDEYPSRIKIAFINDSEVEIVISNKKGTEDLILYDRTMSITKLNNDVMDTLINLFANNNSIYYNIKDRIEGTDTSYLLVIGEGKRSFTIVNATEEVIDKARNRINELMNKNEDILIK